MPNYSIERDHPHSQHVGSLRRFGGHARQTLMSAMLQGVEVDDQGKKLLL